MESTDFWAQIVQLIAVLALALVIEVRAMYLRVQAINKPRTKGARVAIAVMYAVAVIGLTSSFLAGLSGMTGAAIPDKQTALVVYALIYTFFVLVAAPTIPLIWALIDDLPFSPEGIARWKLTRLRARVDDVFRQADRAARAARLELQGAACSDVVAASRLLASGEASANTLMNESLQRFESARLAPPDLVEARDEIQSLLEILADGHDFTTDEAKRWRASARVVRAAGGHSMP